MDQNRFKAFLRGRQWGASLDRQFVDHALADPQLPDGKSWEEVRDYIKQRNPGAPQQTLTAAEYVWQRYVESTQQPQDE